MKATKLNTVANIYANNLKCLFHTECINISHYDEYTEVSLRLTCVIKMDSFRFAVHSIAKSYGVKAEVIGNGMYRDIRITIDEEYEANLLMREGEVLNHEDLPSLKGERIAYTCGTYQGNRAYVTEVTLGEVSRRADGTYDVLDENGKRTGLYYYDNIPFVMAGGADYQAIYKVIK